MIKHFVFDYDSDIGCLTVEMTHDVGGMELLRVRCNGMDITAAVVSETLLETFNDIAWDLYYG